jgi:sensor histidine kinase regulating citrate/malate metabolism
MSEYFIVKTNSPEHAFDVIVGLVKIGMLQAKEVLKTWTKEDYALCDRILFSFADDNIVGLLAGEIIPKVVFGRPTVINGIYGL